MEAAYVIPKKELSSWQKWEFGELDSFKARQKTESPIKNPQSVAPDQSKKQTAASQEAVKQEAIVLPTAEQIEQIYQQAWEEGKTTGYKEGKEQATVEIQRLQSLMNILEQELGQIDQAVAQDLLSLSIDLARKMAGQALQIRPELILPIIEDALRQLPTVTRSIRLTLHPDDAGQIRYHLKNNSAHSR